MRSSSPLGSVAVVNKDHDLRSSSSVGTVVELSSGVLGEFSHRWGFRKFRVYLRSESGVTGSTR